jgi:hypothetical protein
MFANTNTDNTNTNNNNPETKIVFAKTFSSGEREMLIACKEDSADISLTEAWCIENHMTRQDIATFKDELKQFLAGIRVYTSKNCEWRGQYEFNEFSPSLSYHVAKAKKRHMEEIELHKREIELSAREYVSTCDCKDPNFKNLMNEVSKDRPDDISGLFAYLLLAEPGMIHKIDVDFSNIQIEELYYLLKKYNENYGLNIFIKWPGGEFSEATITARVQSTHLDPENLVIIDIILENMIKHGMFEYVVTCPIVEKIKGRTIAYTNNWSKKRGLEEIISIQAVQTETNVRFIFKISTFTKFESDGDKGYIVPLEYCKYYETCSLLEGECKYKHHPNHIPRKPKQKFVGGVPEAANISTKVGGGAKIWKPLESVESSESKDDSNFPIIDKTNTLETPTFCGTCDVVELPNGAIAPPIRTSNIECLYSSRCTNPKCNEMHFFERVDRDGNIWNNAHCIDRLDCTKENCSGFHGPRTFDPNIGVEPPIRDGTVKRCRYGKGANCSDSKCRDRHPFIRRDSQGKLIIKFNQFCPIGWKCRTNNCHLYHGDDRA